MHEIVFDSPATWLASFDHRRSDGHPTTCHDLYKERMIGFIDHATDEICLLPVTLAMQPLLLPPEQRERWKLIGPRATRHAFLTAR